jgi:hypothetical protein
MLTVWGWAASIAAQPYLLYVVAALEVTSIKQDI